MRGMVSLLAVVALLWSAPSWAAVSGSTSSDKDLYRGSDSSGHMSHDSMYGTRDTDKSRSDSMTKPSSDISSRQIGKDTLSRSSSLTLLRSDELIGKDCKNQQDESIGEIKDVVLSNDLSKVSYVALGHGGFMGMGEKLFAIPISEINVNEDGGLAIPVTNQQLDEARGFARDSWPSTASSDFLQTSTDMTGTKNEPVAKTGESMEHRRVSHLLGLETRNAADENIAEIQDVVFNAKDGQVAYCIVSLDRGMMDKGNLAAVPWTAVDIQPDLEVARIDTTIDDLRAIAFNRNNYPDLSDRTYASSIHDRFRGEDWQVFGFVGESGQDESKAEEHPIVEPKSTLPGTGYKEFKSGGADADLTRDYSRDFKADRIETVQRDIVRIGSHTLDTGEGTWVTLRTDDGKTVTVQLAPTVFLREHNLTLRENEKLSVTGSKVREGDTPVYIATRIHYKGQDYNLRDEQGKPLWKEGGITGKDEEGASLQFRGAIQPYAYNLEDESRHSVTW